MDSMEKGRKLNEEVLADMACDSSFWMTKEANRVQSQPPGAWSLNAFTQTQPEDALVDLSDLVKSLEGNEDQDEAIMVISIHLVHSTGLADAELLAEAAGRIPEDGFTPLIGALLEIEMRVGHQLSDDLRRDPMPFKEVALQVLCGMYEGIIPLLVSGNLYSAYIESMVGDDHLKAKLDHHKEQFCLVDSCFGEWTQAQSDAGARRFLQTRESERSVARIEVIKQFTRALFARINTVRNKYVPLDPPLQYCEYSSEFDERDSRHSSYGSSSSWLTGLFISFAKILFRKRYDMKALCVCLIGEEAQGSIPEIIVTRMASAYYHTGGGFSIGLAGGSMVHMTRLLREDRAKAWRDHQAVFMEQTHYSQNMTKDVGRIVTYRKKQVSERTKRNKRELDFLLTGLENFQNEAQWDFADYEHTKSHPAWAQHQQLAQGVIERAKVAEEL